MYPKPDQSSPCPHPTSSRSILILSSHLCLGSPSGLFPPDFPTKILYAILASNTFPAHLILPDSVTQIIFGEEYRSVSSSLCSFTALPSYHVSLRPKYPPQNPILKRPQPTFLPQYECPSFMPIQNNRQNYSSVHLNLIIFG